MYKRILVPVDGSPTSKNGLAEAVRLAKATGARLRVLHVLAGVAPGGSYSALSADAEMFRRSGKELVEDIVARLRKERVQADGVVVKNLAGRAADGILREAKKWRADAIVMGTHGRRRFNRFIFGGDAEIVIRAADVPVLLVRAAPRRSAKGRGRAKRKAARATA